MDTDTPSSGKALTYEDVAKCAQKFLAERPVIVLGTGATIPHGLPSMSELAELLITAVKDNPPGWDKFSQQLGESKNLEQALRDVTTLPSETLDILVQKTWDIVTEKDIAFHQQLLLNGTDSFPLARLFKYLLCTANPCLQVVTTNYDRVAEYAANYVHAYASTGMTPGWLQQFKSDSLKINVGR